jgi:hypothetical protein
MSQPSTFAREAHAIAARDHEPIMRRLVGYDFAFDYQRSMVDLVFVKGLAAPRISGLIGAQGYIQRMPQKRYDDTAIMMVEFVKHGYSSERGARMIARMNEIHARFRIRQEDYLYVLTGLMFEPIRFNARFGWRLLTDVEKLSHFYFWREVGRRMDLTVVPDSYEGCEAFNVAYERDQLRRTERSVELARVLFALLESWVPGPVRPLVRPGMSTLLDDELLACFDLPPPPALLAWLVPRALRLRAWALRFLPRRRSPGFYVDGKLRSYPGGYAISDLGPPDDWTAPGQEQRGAPRAPAADDDDRFCHHRAAVTSPPASRAARQA